MAEDWSKLEVEVIVEDYFSMLLDEIAGKPFNKAEHRRRISPLLNHRSEASIEFKHQNISAVLWKFDQPYISGYKPRWNYQSLLEDTISNYLERHIELQSTFLKDAVEPPQPAPTADFANMIEPSPEKPPGRREYQAEEKLAKYRRVVKVNYVELEQANRQLGQIGEELVVQYEKWRLLAAGKESLSEKIEWVSRDLGDGLGYDILSKELSGKGRYIEVKTTKLGKEAPIYFSRNELEFSNESPNQYFLYRLFNVRSNPKIYILNGKYSDFCFVTPIAFKGSF
jgi:hypothetical protein